MKVKIAAKLHNDEYFVDTFIRYYFELGIDEIVFFDNGSTDRSMAIIENHNFVNDITCVDDYFNLKIENYYSEYVFTKGIYNYTLGDFKKSNRDTVWMYLDIDEYALMNHRSQLIEKFRNCVETNILGSIFINWYTHPSLRNSNIRFDNILNEAINGKLRGYLLKLYDNVVYKHNIIRFTKDSISELNNFNLLPGYHRVLHNQKIVTAKKNDYLLMYHIKGIPERYSTPRLINRFKDLSNSDPHDFTLQHFKYEKVILDDYEYYYNNKFGLIDGILTEIEEEYNCCLIKNEFEKKIIPKILNILNNPLSI